MNALKCVFSGCAIAHRACLHALFCLLLPQLALCAVIPDGTYIVQMADSDHVVYFSTAESPPRVTLKEYSGSALWSFEHLGNDYYKITEQNHYLVLDSCRGERFNGVPIITYPWHGGNNQRWKVVRKGDFYSLINQQTELYLDLKNNNQAAGNVFQGHTANGSRGQLFRLTLKKASQHQQTQSPADDQIKSFSNGPGAK